MPTPICHTHNLLRELDVPKPYGIRVSLPRGDSFSRLIGQDWERLHWYATAEQRDRALAEMSSEHLYSRRGDRPALVFEPVNRKPD
jgi:hypothetical protein